VAKYISPTTGPGLTALTVARSDSLTDEQKRLIQEKMGGRRPAFTSEIAGVVGMLCTLLRGVLSWYPWISFQNCSPVAKYISPTTGPGLTLTDEQKRLIQEKMGGRRPAFTSEIAGVVGMLCTPSSVKRLIVSSLLTSNLLRGVLSWYPWISFQNCSPVEIAGVVGMLCTPDGLWCTGSVVCANGGMKMGQ
jgi:hypothetical protein